MIRPFIIGVGGAHSDIGKTTFAAALLRVLTAPRARPPAENVGLPLYSLNSWGAVKYTKTALHCSITDDAGTLKQKDKDTAKMLEAGATEVLWVQAPPEDLGEVLPMVVERLSGLDGMIVEGNSAIEFLKPDIVIFLNDPSRERLKPSAGKILELADILVFPTGLEDRSRVRTEKEEKPDREHPIRKAGPRPIAVNPLVEKEVAELLNIMNNIAANKDRARGRS